MKNKFTELILPAKTSPNLEWAEFYYNLGWAVIPLGEKSKISLIKWKIYQTQRPTLKEIKYWFTKWPKANIGIICGEISGGLMILDIDSERGKKDIQDKGGIPLTPTSLTARGFHLYFKKREKVFDHYESKNGWELKGNKRLILAPPSIHPSGATYEWQIKPNKVDLAPLPLPIEKILKNKEKENLETGEIEDRKILELLLPYWTPGDRHQLSLALCGYLCKLGWAWPLAKNLIVNIAKEKEDPELKDRLKNLETTFRRGQRGEAITGFKELRDRLSGSDMDSLETLAKRRKIPFEMRELDFIRMKTPKQSPTWEKEREIGNKVIEFLKAKGRFLKIDNYQLYWFEYKTKEANPLESSLIETYLEKWYGINPAEKLMRNVKGSLKSETIANGELVTLYNLAHFNPENFILYVYAGEGRVYRLDGEQIKEIDNGSEGVFFSEIPGFEPWEADFDDPIDFEDFMIKDLNFSFGEGVALDKEDQRLVFWLWVRSLFFEELQPTKPILTITGDKGSGKTTALRRFLKLLIGSKGEVSLIRNEDSWTSAISSSYLLILDNVDTKSKWLPQKMNLAATGQVIQTRQLYTSNELLSLYPRCFVAMTAISSPFSESTLADRMIILKMQPLEKKLSENVITKVVMENRNALWASLLDRLNQDIELLKEEDLNLTFRMADWANLIGKLLSEKEQGGEVLKRILEGLEKEQANQVLGFSVIPQILEIWKPEPKKWYYTAELYSIWKDLAETEDFTFSFKNAISLGRHLTNIRDALKGCYKIRWGADGRGHTFYIFA